MRRLTIIGTTPNGDGVVLSDDKGAKFLVANDPRLAAATGHDLSRQLEMALQTFSPREIQARVRGGDSAEVIAAETGWPLDKVLRYAEPLLAERAYIAEQAQGVELRRSGGGATLRETAADALGVEVDASDISWDAFRREDGKWVVSATFGDREGAHVAQWSYDHAGRNLHPLDDEARALMGARPVAVPDVELDIADALDLVSEIPVVREEAVEARPRLVAVPDAVEDVEELELIAELDELDEAPVAVEDDTDLTIAIPHPSAAETPVEKAAPAAKKAPAKPKPKARKGRASVPSWDEILFGASRPEE
jgi:hypothetical protein